MKFRCPTCDAWRHVEEVIGDPRKDHCWECGTPVPWQPHELARMDYERLSDAYPSVTAVAIARVFDVPPWLVDLDSPPPRWPRLRWALRRVLPRLVWRS